MFKVHVLTVAMRQKTNHTKEKIVDKFFDQNKGMVVISTLSQDFPRN
jgi:hypothetical protein